MLDNGQQVQLGTSACQEATLKGTESTRAYIGPMSAVPDELASSQKPPFGSGMLVSPAPIARPAVLGPMLGQSELREVRWPSSSAGRIVFVVGALADA